MELTPISLDESKARSREYSQASGCLRPFRQREVCGHASPNEYSLYQVRRAVEPIRIGLQVFPCHREFMHSNVATQDYWQYLSHYVDAQTKLYGHGYNLRIETAHLERDVFVSSHDPRILVTAERKLGDLTERLRVAFTFDGNFSYINYHQQDNDRNGDHAQDVVWVRPNSTLVALGHCIHIAPYHNIEDLEKWNDIVCGINYSNELGRTKSVRTKKRSDADPVYTAKDAPILSHDVVWQGSSAYHSSKFHNNATLEVENDFMIVRGTDATWRFQLPPFLPNLPTWDEPYDGTNLASSFENALRDFDTIVTQFVSLEDSGVVIGRK